MSFLKDPIVVDYRNRSQGHGIWVYPDDELEGTDKKTVHSGFVIQMKTDPRWSLDDATQEYNKARIWTDDSVLIGCVDLDYDHTKNLESNDQVSAYVKKDMDEFRNRASESLKQGFVPMRWVLLKFPPRPGKGGVNLSVKEIYHDVEEKDEHVLELDFYPVYSDHPKFGKHESWYASWKVVCKDDDPRGDRKRGKPDAGPKKTKEALKVEKWFKKRDTDAPMPDVAAS